MENTLKGKVAVVTGASKGFGYGIAQRLVENGATVFITSRNKGELEAAAAELEAIPVVADITVSSDWDHLMDTVMQTGKRLDILVNNAGAALSLGPIDEQEDDRIDEIIKVNLTGCIKGCKRAAQIMKPQGYGLIINISSVCAFEAWPGWGIYGAAKAALEHFSRQLYVELRSYNIQVTCLTPSWGDTNFAVSAHQDPASRELIDKMIKPLEIGDVVCNICSLPRHLVIPQITLLPLVQEIVPY